MMLDILLDASIVAVAALPFLVLWFVQRRHR